MIPPPNDAPHYDADGLRITELQHDLQSRGMSPWLFLLLNASCGAPVGLTPLWVFPIDSVIASDRLSQIAVILLISFAILQLMSPAIERLAAMTSVSFKSRCYHYWSNCKPQSQTYVIAFSRWALVWRIVFTAIVCFGWAIPHIVLSVKGINQWWNPPVGLIGLYWGISISWFFIPSHAILWYDDLWLYFPLLGKLRVPLDDHTLMFDRCFGGLQEWSVNRKWLGVSLSGRIRPLFSKAEVTDDFNNLKSLFAILPIRHCEESNRDASNAVRHGEETGTGKAPVKAG